MDSRGPVYAPARALQPLAPLESDLIAFGSEAGISDLYCASGAEYKDLLCEVSDDSQAGSPGALQGLLGKAPCVVLRQASPGPSPWPSEDPVNPVLSSSARSPKGTPKGSPKSSPKATKLGNLASLRASGSESKRLTLPRSDSGKMSTSDHKGKSPRAEKTLLDMELMLSNRDSKLPSRLLPGIERKPSRDASSERGLGSRPESRAGSKQSGRPESRAGSKHSGGLDDRLLLSGRRTPSKSVAVQSAGDLLPKFKSKDKKALYLKPCPCFGSNDVCPRTHVRAATNPFVEPGRRR